MKNRDHNHSEDSTHSRRKRTRETVRVLGTDFQRRQLCLVLCATATLALAMRYGFFEYMGLGPFETVAVAAPFLILALAVACIPARSGPTAPGREGESA